ncbi:non-ribosomal peptide synthetase [Streptomyces megasporus]|uniref:non-ribosomal peptide synthetase n=1 Tax=Streptomyces megasporus TaxID=44060 RepID=UPI0004E221FD|nr:non-ribosomal peptide synthetase [Streptomyces megasporus]
MAFQAVHGLVQQTARRFPERVAVECPQGTLTYAELESRAGELAAALRASGAGVGCVVPILAVDRRELAVAILAVLKTGGVFVPMDLSAPGLRLRTMLTAAAPEWVVVGASAREESAGLLDEALPTARRVELDLAAEPTGTTLEREHVHDPDDAAYIFFTSGSTGRPKAIVGRMQGIDHFVRWETELLGVGPKWRVSQLSSPAFDAILRDLFVPLVSGGTVCVPPTGLTLDGPALARWLDEQRIDLVHCVPTVFRALLPTATAANGPELAALRCIAMAGEPLAPSDVAKWFGRHGERVRLLNMYGPSETTMTKTFHFVTPADAERATIPIGKAMPGARVVLLDGLGRPCAPGTVGEMYIRTPYMSLGYFHQPDATREVFVPNPLGDDPEDFVYRTGDFARMLPDGTLEYVGRRDQQIKIGGVRVELGEVEHLLRTHHAVRDTAVVAVPDDQGNPAYLCAFVELAQPVEAEALRTHLVPRLPDAHVPRAIVPMDRLPRTISGKVDRRALPVPLAPQQQLEKDHVAPRTATEETLAAIWAGLLPVDKPGVRHDFFQLGGHSLLVMRLLAAVTAEFGVEIHLQRFLAAPTIEALAALIEEALLESGGDLDDLLADLDGLDDDEAERLLAQNGGN